MFDSRFPALSESSQLLVQAAQRGAELGQAPALLFDHGGRGIGDKGGVAEFAVALGDLAPVRDEDLLEHRT